MRQPAAEIDTSGHDLLMAWPGQQTTVVNGDAVNSMHGTIRETALT